MSRSVRAGDPSSSPVLTIPRRSRPRRIVPLVLALAAVLTLAGCGDGGPAASPGGAAGTGGGTGSSTSTSPVTPTTPTTPTTPEERATAVAKLRKEFRDAPVDGDGERTVASGAVYPAYIGGGAPPAAGRARCDELVMQQAIRDEIDQLDQPLRELHCARGYAVAILDLGACPPAEGVDPAHRPRCSHRKRSYWKSVDGRWKLLTYVDEASPDCEITVVATEPAFPRRLCR